MGNREDFLEYEDEIDKMTNFLVEGEEKEKGYPVLKQILRNYDEMVKSGNMLESYKMPYWTVCCCRGEGGNNETVYTEGSNC